MFYWLIYQIYNTLVTIYFKDIKCKEPLWQKNN